jgi:hypothetical protein
MDYNKYKAELIRLMAEFKIPDHVKGNDVPAILRHKARQAAEVKK